MGFSLVACAVRVPRGFVAAVAGELTRRGAHVDCLDEGQGLPIIEARIPRMEIDDFTAWLIARTAGQGRIDT